MNKEYQNCNRCCPHTGEIFCLEEEGVRKRHYMGDNSEPIIMDTQIDECPELAIIDLMERHGKSNKTL